MTAKWAKLRWRSLSKVVLFIGLLIAAHFAAAAVVASLEFEIRPSNEDAVHRTIMVSAALYAVLLALPFVPGAEIGLALIAMFGPPVVLLVYACTLAGLILSFAIGRMIPLRLLIRLSEDVRLKRLAALLHQIEGLDRQERLDFLASKAPNRTVPFLLRYRYLALAAAINIPGNIIIGGGGGIALFAGLTRLYSVPGFLITIAIAAAPVPLAVLLFGKQILS